jgi:hypothetical protein
MTAAQTQPRRPAQRGKVIAALVVLCAGLWALSLYVPRPTPRSSAQPLADAERAPAMTVTFSLPPPPAPANAAPSAREPAPANAPTAVSADQVVAAISAQDQQLMRDALTTEFWRDKGLEERGAIIRHIAEIFPWQQGKPAFIPPPQATQ